MSSFRCLVCSGVVHAIEAAGHTCPVAQPRACSKCGIPEEKASYQYLTDISVISAEGEEGYAWVQMLLCDGSAEGDTVSCMATMLESLRALGFVDHRHGGINYLEDDACPGSSYSNLRGECPVVIDEDAYPPVIIPGGGWNSGRQSASHQP